MADANQRLAGNAAIVTGAGSRADGNGRATAMPPARRHSAMLSVCCGADAAR
jgi:hypothetical protein